MEGEGHLTRHRAPKDARAKHVEITTVGLHLLTAVEAIYAELEAEWGLHIGVNQLEGVRTALTDVLLAEFDGSLPPIRPTW